MLARRVGDHGHAHRQGESGPLSYTHTARPRHRIYGFTTQQKPVIMNGILGGGDGGNGGNGGSDDDCMLPGTQRTKQKGSSSAATYYN